MEITINIKGLDQLTESLALLGSAMAYKNDMVPTAKAAVQLMDEVTEPEEKEEIKEVEPEEEKPKVKETKTEKTETETKVTREDVRKAFVAKNSPSTRDKLKALLDKFDTPNISELKKEHFEDVLKELEEI